MKHYKFGYARVSTEQQNLARQLDMLSQYGVDYIFNEKMTGTKRDSSGAEQTARPYDGGRHGGD